MSAHEDMTRHPALSKDENDAKAAPENSSREAKQRKQKDWKNWWYYYKWYVVCAIIVLAITLDVLSSALGLWQKKPDFQVAYIGKSPLSEDAAAYLEQTFASIGRDFNGDGEIIVQINQYVSGNPTADTDTAYYEYADEISLIGDISDCESYFFLTDDPENLQYKFQILANADGSCPKDTDYSTDGKVIAWNDCPILCGSNLASSSSDTISHDGAKSGEAHGESGENLLPAELYLGRRCFFTEDLTEHYEQCAELWDLIHDSYEKAQK